MEEVQVQDSNNIRGRILPFQQGMKAKNAQFNCEQIRDIRTKQASGMLQKDIAAIYSVGSTVISNIINRRNYRYCKDE